MSHLHRLILALAAARAVAQHAPPTNPFCAYATKRNTVTTSLTCENGVIDSVTAL
jgi:hypothetical protein